MEQLSNNASRVQAALNQSGFDFEVLELPSSTRTARAAAEAIGCRVEQIAKSIIFKQTATDEPVLAVASGVNRVDMAKLAAHLGRAIEGANASYVKARTGFVIGGVSPVGHSKPITTLIDASLLAFDEVWAAAGTPHAVFRLRPADLAVLTQGEVIDLAE